MIREATLDDINDITRLGIEALGRDRPKKLLISRDKVREMAYKCVIDDKNFAMVSEHEGEVMGAVVALVHQMLFFERSQCSVVMYYCKQPGEGLEMLRQLMRWAKAKPVIKMVEFTLEREDNERVKKLLTRLGLTESLPVLLFIK